MAANGKSAAAALVLFENWSSYVSAQGHKGSGPASAYRATYLACRRIHILVQSCCLPSAAGQQTLTEYIFMADQWHHLKPKSHKQCHVLICKSK